MKAMIIIASVNRLTNLRGIFQDNNNVDEHKTIIIDEGSEQLRNENDELLSNVPHVFYGPKERAEWFKQHFGSNYKKYLSVIPEKCHAETSFGFLVAYEDQPDIVIELDDDVIPLKGHNLIARHYDNLLNDDGVTVHSNGKCYNTIDNLKLICPQRLFPRGHPYSKEARVEEYSWNDCGTKCVLNMGLWIGNPDLDALTIIYNGGLDGRYVVKGNALKREKVIIDKGVYVPVCSMNTSFLPKIIPAFYQLYMNYIEIDRFDDIWSGIFLKKITDHLRENISLGNPLVYHDKRPRDVFMDLKKELEGMIINEKLWKMVNEVELDGKTYWDAYISFVDELEKKLTKLENELHKKFLRTQIEKMRLWLKIVDELG